MGLIMLILIGTVPTAYALNHAVNPSQTQGFIAASTNIMQVLDHQPTGAAGTPTDNPRVAVTDYVKHRQLADATVPALKALILDINKQVTQYGAVSNVPPSQVGNVRNDMYLASETLRLMVKSGAPHFEASDLAAIATYKSSLDTATKFIPTWVKVAVAIALGLGTMVGWRRIVVTVGEKIGKDHLTYAQGASAELVAMATIGAADAFGLPVSTTHVLSSGVAGTMAANRSGLQGATIRNLLMAWVLTLPVSIALAGALFWLLRHIF
jgi:PiT family inorganic phosphate transporter